MNRIASIGPSGAGLLSVLGLLVAGTPVSADDTDFLPAWEGITGDRVAAHIEVLASDAFEGREPGSAGETRTLEYLQAQFRSTGALPGLDGSYLQEVPLVELKRREEPRARIRAGNTEHELAFGDGFVALAGRPVEAIDVKDLPVIFAGYGISAPHTFGWDDYGDVSVAGGAVMLLQSEPLDPGDETLFRGRALTNHGRPSTKYDLAAARGARAAIVVHTEPRAGYPWSVLGGGGLGRTQQFLKEDGSESKLDMIVLVSESEARRLLSAAGLDFDALVADAERPSFTARPVDLRLSGSMRSHRRDVVSHNVVARIEGSGAPDEAVFYTAHWDHVGTDESLDGDTIFNGAVDNATGTAGLLELARAFTALPEPPRRSVYFVATTAEEKGLLGSEYLASHPIVPLEKTVAVINLDALFPFGSFDALTVTGFGSSEIEDVLEAASARVGRVLQDDGAPEAGAFFRSDHYPFVKRGVPAVFAVGNPRLDVELPDDHPMAVKFNAYMVSGYHKVGDEYDPSTWDMTGIEQDVRTFFETGWRLAEDTRFPNWRYGNEFRPLRDEMMR